MSGNEPSNLTIQSMVRDKDEYNWEAYIRYMEKVNSWLGFIEPKSVKFVVRSTPGFGIIPGMNPTLYIDKGILSVDTAKRFNMYYEQLLKNQGLQNIETDTGLYHQMLIDIMIGIKGEIDATLQGLAGFMEWVKVNAGTCSKGGLWGWFAFALVAGAMECCRRCSKAKEKSEEEKKKEEEEEKEKEDKDGESEEECYPPLPPPEYVMSVLSSIGFPTPQSVKPISIDAAVEFYVTARSVDYIGVSIQGNRIMLVRNCIC